MNDEVKPAAPAQRYARTETFINAFGAIAVMMVWRSRKMFVIARMWTSSYGRVVLRLMKKNIVLCWCEENKNIHPFNKKAYNIPTWWYE